MLPIPGTALGAGFTLASRMLRGEVDVDEEKREQIQEARARLERYSDLVGDFSAIEPGSWARAAGRVIDWTFDTHGDAADATEWRTSRGFTLKLGAGRPIAEFVSHSDATDLKDAYQDGAERLEVLRAPGGVPLLARLGARGTPRDRSPGGTDLYRRPDTPKPAVRRAVRAAFWSDHRAVRLETDGKTAAFAPVELDSYEYRGDKLELLREWRTFLEAGASRNILLQGEPGTGKTTFCCHAARELGSRILLLDGTAFATMATQNLQSALERLQPEIVVIDDIDRGAEHAAIGSADNLRLIAGARDKVPLLLMTSNDHTELPPALRRPGRIDRIVDFGELTRDDARRIVRTLARDEGVELPEGRVDWLADVMAEHSAAHVREALRRADTLGWEAVPTGEATFRLHREDPDARSWLESEGYRDWTFEHGAIVDAVFEAGDTEIAFRGEHETLERLRTPEGVEVCRDAEATDEFGPNCWVRVRGDGTPDDRVAAAVADVFWRNRRAVVATSVERELVFRDASLEGPSYVGPRRDAIGRWQKFIDTGLRRCALLKGPPGTGKSTFARDAAADLTDRALFVTSELFDELSEGRWNDLVEHLRPEVAVVDDIDRVGERNLEEKLRMIEERHCEVPLLIFTCNDADVLPRAMKRPGRIDEILEFDVPDADTRRRLIDKLARRAGVDVPEPHRQHLDTVFREQSPAHVRELLLRADVLGWEEALEFTDRIGRTNAERAAAE